MTARRKLHIKTHGCQMNVYDSDRMTDVLAAEGFETTDRPEEADVIILNTCHIREKAAEKVYSELGRIRALKDAARAAGRQVSVGVAGCVAQAEGAEITRRARHVDFVLGPQSYHKLSEIVARAATGAQVVDTEFPVEDKFAHLPAPSPSRVLARGRAAFLAVQEGCDKFCTFCVVPYTRGAELSRSVAQVVEEARKLAASGVKELTLLGQNVNAYHGEGLDGRTWNLARLLHELAEIDGIERLRYTTSHPRDMDDDLIAAHGTLAALMPYLHLPVQSGSDRVLSAMNRRHGRAFYLDLIARIRDARPDIALSSDFIVGFPGETEAEFAETLSLAREVGYAQAFSFKYSPRPGTPAAEMDDQVPEAVKSERLARLHEVLAASQAAFNRSLIGRTMPVLFEREGRKPGQLVGRSPYLQPVQADAPAHLRGTTATVTITDVGTNSLFGTLTETSLAHLLEDAAF